MLVLKYNINNSLRIIYQDLITYVQNLSTLHHEYYNYIIYNNYGIEYMCTNFNRRKILYIYIYIIFTLKLFIYFAIGVSSCFFS